MAGWDQNQVDAFKKAFFEFLKHVRIDSKELGNICLGDHIYEAQRRLLDGIWSGLAQDIHDFKILKARQLGISTLSRALTLFWVGMHDGLKGAMVFDTNSNKENARREIEAMIESLPPEVEFPRVRYRNRDGIGLSNGATILFMSAGIKKGKQGGGLGRSTGLNFVHCSEISSWENAEGIESFKQSLSETFPNRLYIWESTPRGFNAWFDMWTEAKADDLNQRAIFIGWWAKENQRIKRGTPAFERYGKSDPTDEELKKIKEVRDQYNFDIDMEQLAWFRRRQDPTLKVDEEGTRVEASGGEYLLQEQAWVELDGFLMTGSNFFPADRLSELAQFAKQQRFKAYEIFTGTEFIYTKIYDAKSISHTHLKIWEEPVDDGLYVVAADPAFGHSEDSDRYSIQVVRCYADGVDQVAEYNLTQIHTYQFAWVIAAICGYYKNCQMMLELNGPGEAVWNEWRTLKQTTKTGYLALQAEEKGLKNVFANVRDYIYTRADSMTSGHVFQWKVTEALKESIMERLRDFTMNGQLRIRSMETLEEMRSIVREGASIKAEGKKKDDRVIALAMACRAWEEKQRRALIAQGRTREFEAARKRLSFKDQSDMFSQKMLTSFFDQKRRERHSAEAYLRRQAWRQR